MLEGFGRKWKFPQASIRKTGTGHKQLQLERTQERATLERKLEQERTLHLQQLEQDRALHAASLVQTQNELNSVRAMMDHIQSDGMAGILRVKDAVMQFDDLVKSIGTGQRTRPF